MRKFGLIMVSYLAMLSMPTLGFADLYSQNFDGYEQNVSIGATNPTGPSNSAEQVTTAAKRGDTGKGWNVVLIDNTGSRERFYDNTAAFSLTEQDSFTFSFWINPYTQANSAANCGFIGLFNSQSTASSSNGLASMKYFIGINPGGIGASRDPALAFQVDLQGGGYQQSTTTSTIVGGLGQWYQIVIDYDADTKMFDYKVFNSSASQLISDSYVLGETTTFTVDTFGASNGVASDGRATYAYIDDVSIVPEPVTMTLLSLGGLGLMFRKK